MYPGRQEEGREGDREDKLLLPVARTSEEKDAARTDGER